jgi:hypothetical protein
MTLSPGERLLAQCDTGRATSEVQRWVLTEQRLIVSSNDAETSFPLSKVTSIRSGFARKRFLIVAGIVMLLAACACEAFVLTVTSKLEANTEEVTTPPTQDRNLDNDMVKTKSLLAQLPMIQGGVAFLAALGVWLSFEGWRGETNLEIVTFGGRMVSCIRGQDTKLLAFGNAVAHQLR